MESRGWAGGPLWPHKKPQPPSNGISIDFFPRLRHVDKGASAGSCNSKQVLNLGCVEMTPEMVWGKSGTSQPMGFNEGGFLGWLILATYQPTNQPINDFWGVHCSQLHPGRLTWNIQITHLERKMIFQTSMIMFHVNLQGCKKKNCVG